MRNATVYVMAAVVLSLRVGCSSAAQSEEQRLIGILQSNASLYEKDVACRRLAVIGTRACVPALAALLSHDKLSAVARWGLEPIPDPAVDEALRAALKTLHGRQLVGVIGSLGRRGKRAAVPALAPFLASGQPDVVAAAAQAVAKLGGPAAARALVTTSAPASEPTRTALDQARLDCARSLEREGDRSESIALYDRVRRTAGKAHLRATAALRLILVRGAEGLPLLLEQLRSQDDQAFAVAQRACRELPGRSVTAALAAELKHLPPAKQTQWVRALADRGDDAALPAIEALARQGAAPARAAALRALGQLGGGSAVGVLLSATADDDSTVAAAARQTLAALPGAEVDAAITESIATGDAALRCAAIAVAGERRIAAANAALLQAAGDDNAQVRTAAVAALGKTGGSREIAPLVRRLLQLTEDEDLAVTERALTAICNRLPDRADACAHIVAALPQAPANAKCALLRLLPGCAGEGALQAVRAALNDGDDRVREAAIQSLSAWPTDDVVPDLERVVTGGKEGDERTLALRGYVRLAKNAGRRPAADTVRMFRTAMEQARTAQDRKFVLGGLAGVPHPDALALAQAALSDETVRAEAEFAVLGVARGLAGTDRELARAALLQLAEKASAEVARQARDAVRRLDKVGDYVIAWQVAGSYQQRGRTGSQMIDIPFAPEQDAASKVDWRVLPAVGGRGRPFMLDLRKTCGGEQRVAYVRTWIQSPRRQKARLELGSDDGNKVWLNGKLIATHPASGPAEPGENKLKVELRQGWNALMIKVVQDTGPWEFCARLRRPDGGPIADLRVQSSPPSD